MAVDDQTGHSVDKQLKIGIHTISEDEAIEIANENMACLNPATRSNTKRVKSIQKILNRANAVKTRAANTVEVGYYLINYENEGGFAVVADDDRVLPLHAISDTGSLHISDTINNKGLAGFFSSLPDVDTTIHVIPGPWVNPPTPPVRKVIVSPILTESVRNWGQFSPFNKYCNNCAVCCVALSCGMVMSAFEWPTSYDSNSYDWTDIKSNHYSNDLAILLRELGRLQNLSVNYSLDISTANVGNCIRTFQNFGYEAPEYSNFSMSTVVNYLSQGQPVFIYGNVEENTVGHAWVLDGLYMVKGNFGAVVQPGDNNSVTIYYPHCVWGDDGRANGYFSFSGNSVGGKPVYTEQNEDGAGIDVKFGNLGIIYNFKKK